MIPSHHHRKNRIHPSHPLTAGSVYVVEVSSAHLEIEYARGVLRRIEGIFVERRESRKCDTAFEAG